MPPTAPPEKKGLPPLAWLGMGCGVLLLIGVVAVVFVVAWGKRTMAEAESTLAEVEATMQAEAQAALEAELERLEQGQFGIGDPSEPGLDGVESTSIPKWVPRYPGAGEETMLYHDEIEGAVDGSFMFRTSDSPQQVEEFYQKQTESWPDRTRRESESDKDKRRILEFEDEGRVLGVVVVTEPTVEKPLVIINYESSMERE